MFTQKGKLCTCPLFIVHEWDDTEEVYEQTYIRAVSNIHISRMADIYLKFIGECVSTSSHFALTEF